jgi:hypothetical protein
LQQGRGIVDHVFLGPNGAFYIQNIFPSYVLLLYANA